MQYLRERRDGLRIRVDDDRLQRTGLTAELFDEAWQRAPADQIRVRTLRLTVELGRVVGRAAIVKAPEIGPTDKTLFARRRDTLHRRPSRVVDMAGRLPQTSRVTIIAHAVGEDEWALRTAYCGQYVYPQPWDFRAIAQNGFTLARVLAFWCRAAFLYRPLEFESSLHEDTWAGLIEQAARVQQTSAAKVGYENVRQQWSGLVPMGGADQRKQTGEGNGETDPKPADNAERHDIRQQHPDAD